MKLKIVNPITAIIEQISKDEEEILKDLLTYRNTSITHLLKKHYQNQWFRSKNPEGWKSRLEQLKKEEYNTLVFSQDNYSYIRPSSIPYLKDQLNIEVENLVQYPTPKKIAWAKPLTFDLYSYQEESWQKLLQEKHGNVELCTGCHVKGTKILMFDGSLKNVEDILVGDKIMGPDSTERQVLELHRGIDEMYEISPIKGESFIVNKDHILSLQRTNKGKGFIRKDGTSRYQENGPNPILNVSVMDYLRLKKHEKHVYKLYRTEISFNKKINLKIPPYILGIWLGDGASAGCSLTTMDEEIKNEWCSYIESLGLKITIDNKINNKAKSYNGTLHNYIPSGRIKGAIQNDFNKLLFGYNLIKNKHIPQEYLISSKEERKQLLAGLIDTDGYHGNGYYEIIQKNNTLAENILFLARSLGLQATNRKKKSKSQNGTEGEYNRIFINGDLSSIPVRLDRKKAKPRKQIKNTLRTGFNLKYVGIGEYYGFSLNKDKLYVMGDFTVTHNSGKSAILLKICREMGLKAAVIAPSVSIFNELLERFEKHLGKNNVGRFGDGKKVIGKKITICIGDSLCNIKKDSKEWEFFSSLDSLVVDESHGFASETLEEVCHNLFKNVPYRFFFSGTQTRGDGTEKLLQSIIGKTVHSLSTEDAVKGGFICPHEFRIVNIESSNPNLNSKEPLEQKRIHFLRNKNIAHFVAKLANAEALTHKRQTLILVEELSQISVLSQLLKVPFSIAHSETKLDRLKELKIDKVDVSESIEKFNKGESMVLLGTSCVHVGVNLFPVHNCVNWVGGASPIKTKQGAVGRAIRLGKHNPWAANCIPKERALIWDFNVYNISLMTKHLNERIEFYKDSGGDIKFIKLNK